MRYLGIVGRFPLTRDTPVQADRFDRLQRFLGKMEEAPAPEFAALHAACHALMNGVDRVVCSGVSEGAEGEAWADALRRLFRSDPLPLIVAPNGPPEPLAAAFLALPFTRASCLWLDAEPASGLSERVRCAPQVVPTLTPGRPRAERLPATALLGPLHLGTASALRGHHEAPEPPGLLVLRDRRVRLSHPLDPPGPRLPPRPENQRSAVWLSLEGAFRDLLEPIVLTESDSPQLGRRLEREATVILEQHRRRGAITGYRVRCDESTRGDAPGPVIEVQFREPRGVEAVVLRFTVLARP